MNKNARSGLKLHTHTHTHTHTSVLRDRKEMRGGLACH